MEQTEVRYVDKPIHAIKSDLKLGEAASSMFKSSRAFTLRLIGAQVDWPKAVQTALCPEGLY